MDALTVVLPPSSAEPADLASILYTSGSTGWPKGVMLNHANLWLGAISVAHYLRLTPEDRTLCVLPLSFDYGQNQLLSIWAAGGCAVPLDYLTPRDVMRARSEEHTSELQSLMRISYAVFCLKQKKITHRQQV